MSTRDHDYDEKRDFIRMFINAPVEFAISDSGDWKIGVGKNLSGGGLSFTTEHRLKEGAEVDIKLQPLTDVTPPLEAKVTVIRIDEDENGQLTISTKIDKILN